MLAAKTRKKDYEKKLKKIFADQILGNNQAVRASEVQRQGAAPALSGRYKRFVEFATSW